MILLITREPLGSERVEQQQERPEWELNPDHCNVFPVVYQLSYQANWEKLAMSVDYKPIHAEIEDGNTGIFRVFEMLIGINKHVLLVIMLY